ncbi:hypothetical protein HAX54_031716 [Datura stramonium]|uniref:Uncharacterized protein n=1 Tax=Datura stramonium TaxID=4076 RepID=A0ABS8VAU9_DATST|nr:hypothetical protein [Datura stramonium]
MNPMLGSSLKLELWLLRLQLPDHSHKSLVQTHAENLESEIGDFSKLLVTRTLKLKKLGILCKHVNAETTLPLFQDLPFNLLNCYNWIILKDLDYTQ